MEEEEAAKVSTHKPVMGIEEKFLQLQNVWVS